MSELNNRKKELQELIEARRRKSESPETGGVTGELVKEEQLVPTTFAKKLENFWYHYKFVLLAVVLIAALVISLLVSVLFPERFDATITIASSFRFEGLQADIAGRMEKLVDDVDGNGEKNVEVATFWIAEDPEAINADLELQAATLQKLAVWPTSNDHFLYLLDNNSYQYLTQLGLEFMDLTGRLDKGDIRGDKLYFADTELEEEFYLNGDTDSDYQMFFCFVDYETFHEDIRNDPDVKSCYEKDWALFEKLVELA